MRRRVLPIAKRIFILLICWLSYSNLANAQGGHGTPNNPYRIRKANELVAFANCLSTGNEFYFYKYGYSKEWICSTTPPTSGEYDTIPAHGEGRYFLIPNDIILNEGNVAACDGEIDPSWTVWPETGVFKGYLLGDMHTISGMYIDRPNGIVGVGFFSKMEGDAYVEKLCIVNSYIRGGASNIGGMVGELSGGHINDCFFEGSIRTSGNHVGGLVGLMTRHDTLLPEVSVCFASGHLDCSGDYVAGLVGKVEKGTVRQCYSSMAVRTTDVVGVALSGENPTNGGIGSGDYIANHHVGGIYGYTLSNTGTNSYNPDVDSIRVDTCYFDWQMTDLPSIPGSSWIPANWRDARGAAALSTYDMTYYSMMYFDIKNQKPSLWKNTHLTNVYPYPDPFNKPINVTYRVELDYPNSPLVTTSLIPLIDVFMKPNGNGQSTINNMNDQERKHMKLSNFVSDFVLWKGSDSLDITWTVDSLWPDAVSRVFYAPDNSWNVYLQKQGVVRFTIEATERTQGATGRTRYYDAVVNIPPYVGSAENPFLISNLEDFLAFRDGINSNADFVYHRFLIPRESLSNIHWVQTADIDLASVDDWIPIGVNVDTCFTGYYDGKGHKLMNLTMTGGTDRALFICSKGDIKNLVIEDPHITGCGGSSAALATFVKGGSFENCGVAYSPQAISNSTTQPLTFSGDNCAALIGSVEIGNVPPSSIHITGCFNSCNIVNSVNGHAAGLVGYVNADTCFIERCFNAGDITSTNGNVHPFVGNYINTTRRVFTNCYNTGVLTGTQADAQSTNTTFYNDYHVNPVCEGATKVATRHFIGTEPLVREHLGDDYWLYEDGLYPRPRWTDTLATQLTAIAACTPRQAIDNLPLPDTLTVDSFHDLKTLRDIVNGNYMVIYKDYLLPHYVQDIVFSLTNDINLSDITSNWIPIGTKRFAGIFYGNNHTLNRLGSTTRSVNGLFGTLTGKVYNLNISVQTIDGADTAGAVCAILNGGRIENCSVKKYNNISDNLYGVTVGGIAGVSLTANDSIIGCFNYIDVIGIRCIGGLIAEGGTVKNSANLGDITGNSECVYIGGISGRNTTVTSSINTGTVTAMSGNSFADNYVGGLVGKIENGELKIENCYNAGIVNGENRKYVGGICGVGAPQYCYVSNTVRSTGEHLGSIVGQGNGTILYCCYDQQMSTAGGIDGSDQTGVSEALTTQSMTDSTFMKSNFFGDVSIWKYTSKYYPQLTGINSINGTLSTASAMRVMLNDADIYNTVSHQFTVNYADGGSWQRIGGSNCVTLGTTPSNNLITVTIPTNSGHPAQGVIMLGFRGAGTNGPVYRKVQLWVNLTEANPIIIRDADELKKFRTIINQGSGYYRITDQTFLTTGAYTSSQYVKIGDGGRDLYFKLNSDVDLAFHGTTSSGSSYNVLDLWTSIGTQTHPFLGHFDGGNHTVKNFLIPGGDNQGFFGYIYGGTVKNLTIAGAITTHQTTGNHCGILCGYLNSGTIRNCFITEDVGSNYHSPSRISAITGRNLGFICGTNHYGRIVRCKTNMTQIENATYTSGSCFGGICGYNDFGTIDSCRSHMAINPGITIDTVGGIVGYNHCGILRADTSYNNSYNKTYISYVGCIAGYSDGKQSEIRNCYVDYLSRIPSIGNYIGGVVGKMESGVIDGCEHYGTILAQGDYIGGIAGLCTKGTRITGSSNTYIVSPASKGDYVGGIVGALADSSSVSTSFNSGLVTGSKYVGGIVGLMPDASHFTDCYNTGIVKGIAMVGGLVGMQQEPTVASAYGYSAGWVEGSTLTGAVCGFTTDTTKFLALYYDKRMTPYKGVNDNDLLSVKGEITTEMISTISSEANPSLDFGAGRPWTYSANSYPRLTAFSTTNAGIASTLPVQVGTSDLYNLNASINDTILLPTESASGSLKWRKYSGNGGSIKTPRIITNGKRDRLRVVAHVNDVPFRVVQFSFGISENQPLDLDINSVGFIQFRNLVNKGKIFYYSGGLVFADTATLNHNYVTIPIGADGIYFRLTGDVNSTTQEWTPIGTNDSPFLGYLDGGSHSIHVILPQSTADNRGIFGNMQGRLSNIIVDSVSVTGGISVGSLAGYCCGTIRNCGTRGSAIVKGTSAVGGLVGDASCSQFIDCYNGFDVTGSSMVGGLVGRASDNGAIERSFNYGYIKATSSNSLVAGLVGMIQNSNFKIQNCYNTGAVGGTLNVGIYAGLALNSQTTIANCYNAGVVSGTTYNSQLTTTNCFNDKQMNPHTEEPCTNLLMSDILGEGLHGQLGDTWWSYNDGEYPRLKNLEDLTASKVSVKPINLSGQRQADNIVQGFSGVTTDNVKWYRYGTGSALNAPDPASSNGTFTLAACGADTLKATILANGHQERRIIPLVIKGINSAVDTIYTCSNYVWTDGDGQTYTENGFYTYLAEGNDCSNLKAMELFFAPPIEMSITKHDACMDSYWSKYGHNIGALKATVSGGGFGAGYAYEWSRENGIIDNESFVADHPDSLIYLSSDYYYLTVTDVTPHSVCTAHDTVLVDEFSFNYVVTKWGNCVDTADGWIELVLRQFEFNRDGSPYSIMCWDSTHVLIAEHTISALNPPDESGVPKGYDTLFNLANGLYYMTITDRLGCYQDKQIKVSDPINPKMTLRPRGLTKVYDGQPVSVNDINVVEYDDNWKIPERAEYNITNGQWRQLALRIGDSLIVNLKTPNASITDVGTLVLEIDDWEIKDAETGKEKTCLYHFYPQKDSIVILPAPATVTAHDYIKRQGEPDPFFNFDVMGLVRSEDLPLINGGITVNREPGDAPGTYTITPTGNSLLGNYELTFVPGTLTILDTNLTAITVTGNSLDAVYDGTEKSVIGYTVSGLPDGYTLNGIETTNPSRTAAGTYYNHVSGGVVRNAQNENVTSQFDIRRVSGQMVIAKRPVTISPVNDSKEYDNNAATDPVLTATVTGLVEGETLNYTLERTAEQNVGYYPITVTADFSSNYEVTAETGVFTIYQKEATVKGDTIYKTYGSNVETTLTATVTGAVAGDTLNYSLDCDQGVNAGSYPIVVTLGSNQNYRITKTDGVLIVQPKAVTVTANAASKTYGDADPTLTAAVSGAVGNDVLNYTLSRAAGEDVGTYAITVDESGNPNYTVATVGENLTITKKAATIAADSKTKPYGNDDPVLTATVTGTVGNDVLNYTLSREAGEAIGTYAISAAADPNDNANYDITLFGSQLSITRAMVVVAADNIEKSYGDADPTLTATVSGLRNGDAADVIHFTLSREPGDSVGTYVITPTDTAIQGNYTVNYETGVLTVNKTNLIITTGGGIKVYDGTPLTIDNVTVEGLVNGETVTVTATGSQTDIGSSDNTYDLSWGTAKVENYNVVKHLGVLHVLPASFPLDVGAGTWHAISSPMNNGFMAYIFPDDIENFTNVPYDLYRYEAVDAIWENIAAHDDFLLFRTQGYIYRRSAAATLLFSGEYYSGDFEAPADYNDDHGDLAGFNLMGNPYPYEIYKGVNVVSTAMATGWYSLDPDGSWHARLDSEPIGAAQGFFVRVNSFDWIHFTDGNKGKPQTEEATRTIAINVAAGDHEDVAYAILRSGNEAGEKDGLTKFGHLNPEAPTLSVALNGKRYAIAVMGDSVGSFPLNFSGNGEYTIRIKDIVEESEDENGGGKRYLHLVDRIAGVDVDMLKQKEYTFQSTCNDAGRFVVKLRPDGGLTPENHQGQFAHWNGSAWEITGNGEFEVFDVLGRKLFGKELTTYNYQLPNSIFPATGVYVLRLGERTQKIVVKL